MHLPEEVFSMFQHTKIARLLLVPASLAVLVTVVFGAVAGGDDGGARSGSYEHPKGQNEVVLRVSTGGGFVSPSTNLRSVPQFTLYGDGTIIVTGPTIMIYPGAALPNLQTTKVSEETVRAILSAVQEAGLFDPTFDYGQPGITDQATTTITIDVDGKKCESSIYALGADGAGGLTMEQQQARAAVDELVGKLNGLETFQPGVKWTSYQFASLAVFSTPAMVGGTPDPQPNTLEWPLGDLATLGQAVQPEGFRRAVVTGEDLEMLQPLLDEATEITIWTSGGKEYNLYFRPLLPDETI
jgi:hypothetical protein